MRLDLFLKTSRLVVRRSLAQEFCDKGLISVNGVRAKSSKELKTGDAIEIKRRSRSTTIIITQIPGTKQVSKNYAGELYRLVAQMSVTDDEPS